MVEVYKIDQHAPTLVLTECLLVYLDPLDSHNLLSWCSNFFSKAPFLGTLTYEMMQPFDAFGEVMVANLERRGCELKGLRSCPDIEAQITRMKEHLGSKSEVECHSMLDVYNLKLNQTER